MFCRCSTGYLRHYIFIYSSIQSTWCGQCTPSIHESRHCREFIFTCKLMIFNNIICFAICFIQTTYFFLLTLIYRYIIAIVFLPFPFMMNFLFSCIIHSHITLKKVLFLFSFTVILIHFFY